ncbi:MAG: universal stress protein [Bacteroidota bacterium]
MIPIKRLLFPTDYSRCSDDALLRALWLAELYHADLHIVHVLLPLDYDPFNAEHHLPDLARIQQQVDARMPEGAKPVQPHRFEAIAITTATVRGIAPAPAILTYAREHEIDFIVMGTHGRRGLNHLMMGSVAEEVVRMSPCPVLTVRETTAPLAPIRQILVPLDFSDFSCQALAAARSIAADVGATIRALHVIEEVIHPSFYVTGQTSLSSWYPEIEATSVKEMQKLADKAGGPDVPLEFHVKEGRATVDIVSFAKRNDIQLIVMASHGLTGIDHFLLGSVTEKVVRLAPCPVLVIKSFGARFLAQTSAQTAEA